MPVVKREDHRLALVEAAVSGSPKFFLGTDSAPHLDYTDRLFSFKVTRPKTLRFRSGEFVMIGLLNEEGKPLLRAYSIASPAWDDELEFYSIKVQDGPLTSKLQHIKKGDKIILRPKPVGTLVHDALLPGKRIWFFATGTGIAPFASLLREPQTYEDFEQIILTHTCRNKNELAYGENLIQEIRNGGLMSELVGDDAIKKLIYYPTTTRDPSNKMGRITDLLENGKLQTDLGIDTISEETDRAMELILMVLRFSKIIFGNHFLKLKNLLLNCIR